jgi:hypothetical protein
LVGAIGVGFLLHKSPIVAVSWRAADSLIFFSKPIGVVVSKGNGQSIRIVYFKEQVVRIVVVVCCISSREVIVEREE